SFMPPPRSGRGRPARQCCFGAESDVTVRRGERRRGQGHDVETRCTLLEGMAPPMMVPRRTSHRVGYGGGTSARATLEAHFEWRSRPRGFCEFTGVDRAVAYTKRFRSPGR